MISVQHLTPPLLTGHLLASQQIDENTVTPGVIGFFAIFFVAAATVLLVLDMTKRVRRTRYRGEIREQLEAERAAQTSVGKPDSGSVNDQDPPKS